MLKILGVIAWNHQSNPERGVDVRLCVEKRGSFTQTHAHTHPAAPNQNKPVHVRARPWKRWTGSDAWHRLQSSHEWADCSAWFPGVAPSTILHPVVSWPYRFKFIHHQPAAGSRPPPLPVLTPLPPSLSPVSQKLMPFCSSSIHPSIHGAPLLRPPPPARRRSGELEITFTLPSDPARRPPRARTLARALTHAGAPLASQEWRTAPLTTPWTRNSNSLLLVAFLAPPAVSSVAICSSVPSAHPAASPPLLLLSLPSASLRFPSPAPLSFSLCSPFQHCLSPTPSLLPPSLSRNAEWICLPPFRAEPPFRSPGTSLASSEVGCVEGGTEGGGLAGGFQPAHAAAPPHSCCIPLVDKGMQRRVPWSGSWGGPVPVLQLTTRPPTHELILKKMKWNKRRRTRRMNVRASCPQHLHFRFAPPSLPPRVSSAFTFHPLVRPGATVRPTNSKVTAGTFNPPPSEAAGPPPPPPPPDPRRQTGAVKYSWGYLNGKGVEVSLSGQNDY